MTRYIEVRFICPQAPDKEQVAIMEGHDLSIEQIRDEKQASMDALRCGDRHVIVSVGEVDRAHAVLTNKKQMDAQESIYYDAMLANPDEYDDEEDYEPQYEDWDDPYLPYGDEDW